MDNSQAIFECNCPYLKLVRREKIRELYEIDNQSLLFVATDGLNTYDVIVKILIKHYFNLAKDQHLHRKSNFNEWKFFIDNTSKLDVVGKLNDGDFIYNPNANDVTTPTSTIQNNNTEVNRNNNADINTQLTNFFDNPLNHIRLVEEAEKIDADMTLIISKNVNESVLRVIRRFNNGFRIIERLKSKYGNANADMEY
ncbi:hypothetical protein U3516DRAFT_765900 [Neocallimastix sp. 'constans']